MKQNLIAPAVFIFALFCGGSLFAFAKVPQNAAEQESYAAEEIAAKTNGPAARKGRAVTASGVLVQTPSGAFALTQGRGKNRVSYTISPDESDGTAYAALSSYAGKTVRVTGVELGRTSAWNITISVTAVEEI